MVRPPTDRLAVARRVVRTIDAVGGSRRSMIRAAVASTVWKRTARTAGSSVFARDATEASAALASPPIWSRSAWTLHHPGQGQDRQPAGELDEIDLVHRLESATRLVQRRHAQPVGIELREQRLDLPSTYDVDGAVGEPGHLGEHRVDARRRGRSDDADRGR
jgi:hypothetical protein